MGELENDRYKGREAVSYCQASTNLQIYFSLLYEFRDSMNDHAFPRSRVQYTRHVYRQFKKKCQSYIQEI